MEQGVLPTGRISYKFHEHNKDSSYIALKYCKNEGRERLRVSIKLLAADLYMLTNLHFQVLQVDAEYVWFFF